MTERVVLAEVDAPDKESAYREINHYVLMYAEEAGSVTILKMCDGRFVAKLYAAPGCSGSWG